MPEQTDHDIIIRLDTKLDLLTQKVDDMSSNTALRIERLEALAIKLESVSADNTKIIADHEARMRVLESTLNQGKGSERVIQAVISIAAVAIVELALKYLFHL